ncbi:hypothetical protein T440DRAFT_471669 [Plenodomus tracheiphilus IPT5]|uniref:Uncharacterized protein n=1 Tax=Plenodomus tracheiphilus IPT5 TaxID=1408161 RepID=A0A6A7ATD8_9PLEO|nr:hypothetical protein T440DRAFT_471669 [Plenodomus tracheiphilus IPT5]
MSHSDLSSSEKHEQAYLPGEKAAGKRPADQGLYLTADPEDQEVTDYNYPHRPSQKRSSPSLFVPEGGDSDDLESIEDVYLDRLNDELDISAPATGPSHSKYTAMEGLERARAIKREIENNISVLQTQANKTTTRHIPQEDPENVLIKTLRDDQKMKWSDIAKQLNDDRRERGEPADFTDQKVYCRYIQTIARIAIPVREIGFDPRDYIHLRNSDKSIEGGLIFGSVSKNAKKRLKNPLNPTELKVNLRQVVNKEEAAELKTPEKTEQLMRAVEKVERNFWVLVADEMERATTKLYDPDTLADRYHAI